MATDRPTAGELRRRAARLCQLRILRAFEPDDRDRPTRYTATTTAGEVVQVPREHAHAYLQGLAHGAHTAGERAPSVGESLMRAAATPPTPSPLFRPPTPETTP